jgi:hypothetical protein
MSFVRHFPEGPPKKVPAVEHQVWRVLTYRPTTTTDEYVAMLKAGNRKPGTGVIETFKQFPLRDKEAEHPLFAVSLSELGFSYKHEAHYDEFLQVVPQLGYSLCAQDTAVQLAREFRDQRQRMQFRVAAPPVMVKGMPHIYRFTHEARGQLWISLEPVPPSAHFGPQTIFVLGRAEPA